MWSNVTKQYFPHWWEIILYSFQFETAKLLLSLLFQFIKKFSQNVHIDVSKSAGRL